MKTVHPDRSIPPEFLFRRPKEGVLAAASVYDSETNRALSNSELGVTIPKDSSGNINFTALLADPSLQVVKEVRIVEAVPSFPGIGMEDIGRGNHGGVDGH